MKLMVILMLLVATETFAVDSNVTVVVIDVAPSSSLPAAIQTNCDLAVGKLQLVKAVTNVAPCRTRSEASTLLYAHTAVATSAAAGKVVEHKGFYLFSRFESPKPDDGSFKSGFAVKKGTAGIYRWQEE